ncbi:MAG: hypothetical protein IEMM0002_1050 [bacterium]|nr:MAG: hypothetical protein IEMM0002_1050 [bacterium]
MSRWIFKRIYMRALSVIFLLFSFSAGVGSHYDIGIGKYFEKDHFHKHKVCSASSPLADCSVSVEENKSLTGNFARYEASRFLGENPNYELNHVHVNQSSEAVTSNQDNVPFFTSRLQETVFTAQNISRISSESNIKLSPEHPPFQTRAPPSV